ncbi:hypothetical protein WMY93_023197 [Mugilogobius chulae]|uniref:EGF-like domain-containing protein n=1 Tax=Mugilogobius chulae TaxID=88201 RepID=A0AAW0NG15_9GOBI
MAKCFHFDGGGNAGSPPFAECPAGTFGYGCQQLCECLNNATCDYVTGTCYCSSGYKGIRCDQAALMMEELNPYTKISPARSSERQSAGAVMGVIFLLLIVMALLSLFVWYRQRQRDKGQEIQPSVSYSQAMHITNTDYSLSECGSTVAMRPSPSDVTPGQNGGGAPCFSNPSYHTVAQCNVVSTISSGLDGTLTLKSSTLKGRSGSEWRAFCNLGDIDERCTYNVYTNRYAPSKFYYIKGSMCNNSSCSINSDNPYATIRDPPGLSCKLSESSYVEVKSPSHREVPFGGQPRSWAAPPGPCMKAGVSVLQGPNGMATGFSQNPYDLPRPGALQSHLKSHYDLLPLHHSSASDPPLPALDADSPSSLL